VDSNGFKELGKTFDLPNLGPVSRRELNEALALVMMENFLLIAILLEVEPAKAQHIAGQLRAVAMQLHAEIKGGGSIGLDIDKLREDWNSDIGS
jgi:hypothetical protein